MSWRGEGWGRDWMWGLEAHVQPRLPGQWL